MRVALVAALLILAAAVAATGHAAPAPPPGELWSEFPLEPPVETAPAASSPDPTPRRARAGATEAGPTEAGATKGEALGPWLLLAVSAAAAMAALATVGALGVPIVRSRHEGGAIAAQPAARVVRRKKVAVKDVRPEPPEQSLVEVLSPHPRLHEAEQDEAETETRQTGAEEACEIVWWRGYVKSQFYVQSDSPLDEVLTSRLFRFRGSEEPEQEGAAADAHRALVEELRAAGWVPDGRGEQWFSERFRRSGPTA